MNMRSWAAVFLTLVFLNALDVCAQSAVIAEPDEVQFTSMSDTVSIRLFAQGKPLPSKAVKGVRLRRIDVAADLTPGRGCRAVARGITRPQSPRAPAGARRRH